MLQLWKRANIYSYDDTASKKVDKMKPTDNAVAVRSLVVV